MQRIGGSSACSAQSASGVTPQSIILESRPDFAITHAPGCMLVTDRRISEFAIQ